MRYRRCLVPSRTSAREKEAARAHPQIVAQGLSQSASFFFLVLFLFARRLMLHETDRVSISISCCRCKVYTALLVVYDTAVLSLFSIHPLLFFTEKFRFLFFSFFIFFYSRLTKEDQPDMLKFTNRWIYNLSPK
jgi:hypothetical protein